MPDAPLPHDPSLRVFAYAVAEKAWLYVPLVEALVGARERYRLQLRPAEVARELAGAGVEEVAEALEALAAWGNVTRFYDTSAPETLEAFYSRRFLYQLTEAGAAAHEGIRAVRRAGLDSGRLSGVLLPGIMERLGALGAELSTGHPDGPRVYHLLIDLFASFAELAENAARYMNDLAVETTEIASDDEAFTSYKRAVFTYLDEFVSRLADTVPLIAAAITELDPEMEGLIELAAQTDAAPVLSGDDDGVRRSFATRWAGVSAWFVAQGAEPAVAESLRTAMLDALNRILAAVGRLHEAPPAPGDQGGRLHPTCTLVRHLDTRAGLHIVGPCVWALPRPPLCRGLRGRGVRAWGQLLGRRRGRGGSSAEGHR